MPKRRLHLTAADSAWLQMETPTNLMTITGVMALKERLDFDSVRRVIEKRLLVHDRFRMRVVRARGGLGRHTWAEHPFAIAEHVIRVTGAEGWTKGDLQDLVSREMSTPLDQSKPMWRFLYIEDYPPGGVLVSRIHHCIGDGVALMKVLLNMADPAGGGVEMTQVGARKAAPADSKKRSKVLEALRLSGQAVGSAGYLLTMRRDPKTVFKGDLGTEKLAVWSESIPLDEVKYIGRRLGGTVNDVLLSAVAGALRHYMRGREQAPDGLDVRAVVPVNLRKPEDTKLCNRFGLVYLALPIGLKGRVKRLHEVKRRMDKIKRSPEAFVLYGLLRTAGMANAGIQSAIVKFFAKNATAVMTNVPGPPVPLAFGGAEIDHMMFWVPQSGRLGMGVSILSYNNQVRVGVATDKKLVDDPQRIVAAFESSLARLREAAAVATTADGAQTA